MHGNWAWWGCRLLPLRAPHLALSTHPRRSHCAAHKAHVGHLAPSPVRWILRAHSLAHSAASPTRATHCSPELAGHRRRRRRIYRCSDLARAVRKENQKWPGSLSVLIGAATARRRVQLRCFRALEEISMATAGGWPVDWFATSIGHVEIDEFSCSLTLYLCFVFDFFYQREMSNFF